MNNQTHPSVASSTFTRRSLLLSLLTFVALSFIPVDDADAITRTSTRGGAYTNMHDHGLHIRCTWVSYEGEWASDPNHPITVSHQVGVDEFGLDTGQYATCSGWDVLAGGTDPVEYIGGGQTIVNHAGAPHGYGQFRFQVRYTSATTTTCIQDANLGIGNDCIKFTDGQNKNHIGNGAPNTGATFACEDNDLGPGTTSTYQFYCADGVEVDGFLTLVPFPDGGTTPQGAPDFTGPCSPDRVAAGDCTVVYGGIPTKTVKIKGVTQTVVDVKRCEEAFPVVSVPNALNSGQTQDLATSALLFYQETSHLGSCDLITGLPTEGGSATAAYGRYCTSDIDTTTDNLPGNIYAGDPTDNDSFDNELRVCEETKNNGPHVGFQDVEAVQLANIDTDSSPTTNLNCESGNGGNDSGIYKVWIPTQGPVSASSISTDPAPTLEGVSPSKAVLVDLDGVQNLELTYPTCSSNPDEPALSESILANHSPLTNQDIVILNLTGDILTPEGSLEQTLNVEIEVKVNGL